MLSVFMRNRKGLTVVSTVIIISLATFVVIKTSAQIEQQRTPQQRIAELEQRQRNSRANFRERIELARLRGQRQLLLPAVINNWTFDMPANPEAADQALSNYTVVIAQLIGKKSYMSGEEGAGDEGIGGTWNKFRIIETLSQAPPQPQLGTWSHIPEEWLPVGENEFLMHSHGGTVTIDGVEVTQYEASIPPFREGQRYLLVLSLDPSTRIGTMALGLYGYSPVNSDNTLDARRYHTLQEVIRTRHGGSIEQLRNALRIRTG